MQTTAPATAQADATKAITALRKRLSRWEMDHLRAHSAELADKLEIAQHRIEVLEDEANQAWRWGEHWRDQSQELATELQEAGKTVGLTIGGELVVMPEQKPTAAATALQRRARLGIVAAAAANNPYNLRYWQGCAGAAADMLNGRADQMAAKDAAASSANQPQTGLQAAVAALPERAEQLTMAEVQQILTAQGVEIASDLVAELDIRTGEVFKHRELPGIVDTHDEHAATRVEMGHCACGHGSILSKETQAPIVPGTQAPKNPDSQAMKSTGAAA